MGRAALIVIATAALLAVSSSLAAGATSTYVELGGVDVYLQHPRTLSFSVDGDLVGEQLHWTDWGGSQTAGDGAFVARSGYPSYETVRARGTVVLSELRACRGANYYTHETFHVPGLPFRPTVFHLYTPCTAG